MTDIDPSSNSPAADEPPNETTEKKVHRRNIYPPRTDQGYDPVADSADQFEQLLGMPHSNLDDALLSHGVTLDRIFHRLAMYGGGSKAKTIDKSIMELALQTQLQFRRTYETIRRKESEEQQAVEKYYRSKSDF